MTDKQWQCDECNSLKAPQVENKGSCSCGYWVKFMCSDCGWDHSELDAWEDYYWTDDDILMERMY